MEDDAAPAPDPVVYTIDNDPASFRMFVVVVGLAFFFTAVMIAPMVLFLIWWFAFR